RLLAWHTNKRTETILPQIAGRAVPLLGVGCGICLIEGDQVRVVVAHADPEVEARLRKLFSESIFMPGFSEFLLRVDQNKDKNVPEFELERLLERAPTDRV